jgi:hypothetical protein
MNDPLRDDQAASLYSTVLAETRRAGEEKVRIYPSTDPRAQLYAEFQEQQIAEDSAQRVIDSARSYLLPAQLAALQNSANVAMAKERRKWLEARRAQLETSAGR